MLVNPGSLMTRQALRRHNLLTYSEQFDNAAWLKARCTVTANATTAPDGTVTADKLVEDTTNNSHPVYRLSEPTTNGLMYQLSVYAKPAGRTGIALNVAGGFTSAATVFDISGGTVLSGAGAIQAAGNGFYRCSISITASATGTGGSVYIQPAIGTSYSYLGDGASGIYIWGAQLNEGALSPYIKTEGSAI